MKPLFTFLICLLAMTSYGQIPDWTWATSAGGAGNDEAVSIKSDPAGNIYTLGNYECDSLIFGGIMINKVGLLGKFICKHDPDGNVIWVRNIPGSGYATALDVDKSGNCFVTGYFSMHGLVFGSDIISTDINGSYDLFLLKYDKDGDPVWGKTVGGNDQERGFAVAIDASGSVYVGGSKGLDTVFFGTDVLVNSSGSEDALLVKFDSLGNELWARNTGFAYNAKINSIAVDKLGYSYVIGNYTGQSISFGTKTLTNSGDEDVFVVKYSPDGHVVWAKNAGGTGKDWGQSIVTDGAADVIITGSTASSIFTYTLNLPVSGAQWFDIYVVKMDSAGNVIWGKRFGGMDNERGNSVTVDRDNNIYLAGQFASPSLSFGSATISSAGAYDMYVAKFESEGNLVWVKRAGGNLFDGANAVTATASGYIYTCGVFHSSTLIFSPFVLANVGPPNIFISKIEKQPLGINLRPGSTKSISVYPNPFTGKINTINSNDRMFFRLINAYGQLIWNGSDIDQHDFSGLPSGFYTLIADDSETVRAIKLAK